MDTPAAHDLAAAGRARRGPGLALGVAAAAGAAGLAVSWLRGRRTSAWTLRWLMGRVDAREVPARAAAMRAMVPAGVDSVLDVPYRADRPWATVDVHRPAGAGPLPTVVWVHGGAFVAGTKADLREYLAILASHGFTVVAVDYTWAPAQVYPEQLREVCAAVDMVVAQADRFGVDPTRLALGGDSAGAHIAAQTAFSLVDPAYAAVADLPRPEHDVTLRALLLCCGVYEMAWPYPKGVAGWAVRTVARAYSGVDAPHEDPRFAAAGLVDNVPAGLPPTYVTCGGADPLLRHSVRLVDALEGAGTTVDAHLYDRDDPSRLPHEYQVDLRRAEARESLDRIVALLERATSAGAADGTTPVGPGSG